MCISKGLMDGQVYYIEEVTGCGTRFVINWIGRVIQILLPLLPAFLLPSQPFTRSWLVCINVAQPLLLSCRWILLLPSTVMLFRGLTLIPLSPSTAVLSIPLLPEHGDFVRLLLGSLLVSVVSLSRLTNLSLCRLCIRTLLGSPFLPSSYMYVCSLHRVP